MARKRMIDPEFWSDEDIGKWSLAARLFYIGLWNFADDKGRFKAHPNLLNSQIFPYDSDINIEKLKKELNNKIQWYEIEGCQYGYIHNFLTYQKIDHPSDSQLPPPPHSTKPPRSLDEPSRKNAPNIREVNIREEKVLTHHHSEEDFIKILKENTSYKHINIDIELGKMDAWLLAHKGRQKTKRFIVSWLNKIETPLLIEKPKPLIRPPSEPTPPKDVFKGIGKKGIEEIFKKK